VTSELRVARVNGGRATPDPHWLLAVILVVTVLVGVVVARALASTPRSTVHYTYGGLPSWLSQSSPATNRVLVASPARPQLGIEGDVIKVTLPTGTTWATMTGPQVPAFVAPPPPYTTCTLTIALRTTSGDVLLRARDFAVIDGNGTRYFPATFVGGQRSVTVASRDAVSVRVREFMAIGSGSIRWAPAGHRVVTWEFTVEND
jgi:hypothetical protein